MSNPYAAAYPYDDGTFRKRCPNCGQTNQVSITKQDGHNESEEYRCANCGHLLGAARASNTPHTMIVADEAGEDATNSSADEDAARNRIKAAAAATDVIEERVAHALTLLHSSFDGRVTNGHGVYADLPSKKADLREAIMALNAALQRMQDTTWPGADDYEAVE